MNRLLHAHYQESDEAYAACEDFWRELFRGAIADAEGDPRHWQSWLPRHFANGTPFAREDLPILEARSTSLSRAVRVHQWEATPGDQAGVLGAWVDDYNGFDDSFPRHELFLSVLLDRAVAEAAKRILTEWCRADLDLSQFATFLRTNQIKAENEQ
jgi:hypothetical protein